VFAVTHGNEISGFDALLSLLEEQKLDQREIHGKLFLIVHNIEAYKSYRDAAEIRDLGDTEFRFLDINMNRIYDESHLNDASLSDLSEIKRAKQIINLVPEFDYVLDIHSTSRPSDPMLIGGGEETDMKIADQLFFYRHILDIFNKIPGESLLGYVKRHGKRGKNTVAIAVECGSHFLSSSKYCARKTVIRFLQATGVVNLLDIKPPKDFSVTKYRVIKNILPKYDDFRWTESWSGFQKAQKGTILARENNTDIVLDDDYILIMPTAEPKPGGDGVYLAKAV
jgi:predicted deacylase